MPLKDPIARRAYQKQWERKQPPRVRTLTEPQRARSRELARIRRANGYKHPWPKTEADRKRRNESARRWRAANPERMRAINKACYLRNLVTHPDRYKGYTKKWTSKNPEKAREIARKSYAKNKRSRCEGAKKWRHENPSRVLQFGHARRARKRAAIVEDCSARIAVLKTVRFCHWCCVKIPNGKVTIDHVTPLSRGGKHCSDNLVAACLTCNTSKKAKLVSEWTWELAA